MKKLVNSGVISITIGVIFSLMLAFYACKKEDQMKPIVSSAIEPTGIALKESCKANCSGGSCKCSGDNSASCGCHDGVPECACTEINISIDSVGREYFLEFIDVVSHLRSPEAAKVATDLRALKVAFERQNVVQYKQFIRELHPDVMKMSNNEKMVVNQFFVKWGVNETL